ncbi:MAG: SoxR reducing system RseC family protein [Pseudomonadota bacterium]
MLKESCEIVALDENSMWLESHRRASCAKCESGQGCGGGTLAKLVGEKRFHIKVKRINDVNLHDIVDIQIPDEVIVKSSLIIYLIPLCFMIVLTLFFQIIAEHFLSSVNINVLSILGATLGLGIGLYVARCFGSRIIESRLEKEIIALKPLKTIHCL